MHLLPPSCPKNISDYIRFCRNFSLMKEKVAIFKIKNEDFFFVTQNHPVIIQQIEKDKTLYYV
jgi:hypothetical protein